MTQTSPHLVATTWSPAGVLHHAVPLR
jgi:hypothetical protein